MLFLFRKTKRLHIRPLRFEDFRVWREAQLRMSPSKNCWDLGPKPPAEITKENFKKILAGQKERRQKGTYYDFGVFDTKGNLVGGVSLMEVSRGVSQTAFLGYRVFNNCWRRGYGKEAVRAMIDIGFKDLRLHRIEAGIEPGNIRSIRLAKSLKMRREGIKKRAIFLRNQWVDLIMYTLTTEDVGIRFDSKKINYKSRH